ncbi:MAG TPA: peptide ABC transporter substrate-binding protein [Sphingobium sp.]|nr:peptide ABC transporter substrate-binding protein [Sphingobium sp.]
MLLAVLVLGLVVAGLSWVSGRSDVVGGVDPRTGTVTLSLADEPPQLDSSMTADQISSFILGHVEEGLLRFDQNNHLAPGVAERWEIGATGATFWLRDTAKWSDGQPVTAHDFVFAWRNAVDPKSASEYANIMFGIKNAEAISAGKLPITALGVQAVNDRELRVEFAYPVPYFAQLTAFNVFYPIREDFYRATGGRYASSADTLLYNGPFRMTLWVHGAHIRLEKNPHYWDRDQISLNVLDFPYFTSDPSARINLFRDGKIAMTEIGQENLEEAQLQGWKINSFMDGSLFYVEFNHRPGRLTRNRNLRKAIQYALDPAELVNRVIKIPGYLPGRSLFPMWLDGVHGKFRAEYPVEEITPDPAKARHYLDLAKKELGLTVLPPLILLTGDTTLAQKEAEYYQETLRRTLGLEVRIDNQIFKQRLAKMLAGDFDMVSAGWGPDYSDPLTFGDLFTSDNGNNRGEYRNPALDRLVQIARTSTDPRTRMDAFGKIQQIIVDDAVIVSGYERARLYVIDPVVTGMVRRVTGPDPDWTRARITSAVSR